MPIEYATGDLLRAPVEALVNPVNTKGVMGKGLALQFKRAYPQMFAAYRSACAKGELSVGRVQVYALPESDSGPRWILNFPTKEHWRSRSKLEHIRVGLDALIAEIRSHGIESLALPALGCGHGGLEWAQVEPLILDALTPLRERVLLYAPRPRA